MFIEYKFPILGTLKKIPHSSDSILVELYGYAFSFFFFFGGGGGEEKKALINSTFVLQQKLLI